MTRSRPTLPVAGVVFDMDGTLTETSLDFDAIRAEGDVPEGKPILEFIADAGPSRRHRLVALLERHERRAARDCRLRPGVAEVLRELRARGLRTALLTRNSAASVQTVLERFGLRFDCWLSRDHGEPKPSPRPLLQIARRLNLQPEELLMVGDYVFDVQAGRAAGAHTAFIATRPDLEPPPQADVVIRELCELLEVCPNQGGGQR